MLEQRKEAKRVCQSKHPPLGWLILIWESKAHHWWSAVPLQPQHKQRVHRTRERGQTYANLVVPVFWDKQLSVCLTDCLQVFCRILLYHSARAHDEPKAVPATYRENEYLPPLWLYGRTPACLLPHVWNFIWVQSFLLHCLPQALAEFSTMYPHQQSCPFRGGGERESINSWLVFKSYKSPPRSSCKSHHGVVQCCNPACRSLLSESTVLSFPDQFSRENSDSPAGAMKPQRFLREGSLEHVFYEWHSSSVTGLRVTRLSRDPGRAAAGIPDFTCGQRFWPIYTSSLASFSPRLGSSKIFAKISQWRLFSKIKLRGCLN